MSEFDDALGDDHPEWKKEPHELPPGWIRFGVWVGLMAAIISMFSLVAALIMTGFLRATLLPISLWGMAGGIALVVGLHLIDRFFYRPERERLARLARLRGLARTYKIRPP